MPMPVPAMVYIPSRELVTPILIVPGCLFSRPPEGVRRRGDSAVKDQEHGPQTTTLARFRRNHVPVQAVRDIIGFA